jgi:hypothetical protein
VLGKALSPRPEKICGGAFAARIPAGRSLRTNQVHKSRERPRRAGALIASVLGPRVSDDCVASSTCYVAQVHREIVDCSAQWTA